MGLLSLNLDNKIVIELGIGNKVFHGYVAVHDGKIYCTNTGCPSVQCYNSDRTLVWDFKDQALKGRRGIAVDKSGIVYVGNQGSGNVIIASPDGSKYKAIKINSIPSPRTRNFNKGRTRLHICGDDGPAGIFLSRNRQVKEYSHQCLVHDTLY